MSKAFEVSAAFSMRSCRLWLEMVVLVWTEVAVEVIVQAAAVTQGEVESMKGNSWHASGEERRRGEGDQRMRALEEEEGRGRRAGRGRKYGGGVVGKQDRRGFGGGRLARI